MPQFKRATFIINPRSGKIFGKPNIIRLIDHIWGAAGRDYSILITTRPEEGIRLALEEVERGSDLIIAVGGDGTLNEVAGGILGSGVPVGLVPAGSGNGFARHWNIPLDPAAAIKGLLTPKLAASDVGMAENHLFLVTFGCGMDAVIAHRYARSKVRGMPSYFYHSIWAYRDYQSSEISVQVNSHIEYNGRPLLLSLANARGFGGGTIIAPHAKADDGILDLCVLDRLPIQTSLYHLPGLFNGKIESTPGYHHAELKEALITRQQNGPIHVDGEPFDCGKEIHISVLQRALPLALPN
ncbi:MAG: diacylglycerol kinase family protein [bacterium]|nr:diacylglycerol kinase family protein [bacterium]